MSARSMKRDVSCHNSKNKLLCCLAPLLLISILTMKRQPELMDFYAERQDHIVAKLDDIITTPLTPFSERIQDLDHYFMLPKNYTTPKGILIFLHSCGRSGSALFQLPEERIIVYDALQKGLAVFSPTSRHRESGCWTQMDLPTIEEVVDEFTSQHKLQTVPRIGMGDSSGASFLFFVFKILNLKSMAIYNSPQSFHPDDLEKGLGIPAAFFTMTADDTLYAKTLTNYEKLKSSNIPSQLYKVAPRPFTADVCIARFPELKHTDCEKIISSIWKELPNLLDRRYFVRETLTKDQWSSFFSKLDMNYESAQAHYMEDPSRPGDYWIRQAIQLEIQSCQGFHALTSEHHALILEFIMQQAGIDIK